MLQNQWITEEIKEEFKEYLETNDNENMTIHNLWAGAKAILRVKFIAIQSYFRKQTNKQNSNILTLYLKQLGKVEKTKHNISRRNEIIKIRAEINEIEVEKTERNHKFHVCSVD